VSVSGGAFSAGRVFRGGAASAVPSSYYMGFWPCQQADGDADDEQVTDRSGKSAHASIGSLTSTEAWANAGYVTTIAEAGHFAQVPLAKWTHRFTLGSLIVAGWSKLQAQASTRRFMGHGTSETVTGFALAVATTGALQVNIVGTGSVNAFSTATTEQPYSTDSLHSWLMAYDFVAKTISIGIDGAIVQSGNTAVTAAQFAAADGAVSLGPAIGGRSGVSGATTLVANTTRFVHAFDLVGKSLPTNLAAICQRLYTQPRLMLRDQDFVF